MVNACASCRYPYEDPPKLIKKQLLACMKELEKEHIQMKDDYESDDPERIEEANQLNNRVRDATRSPLAHRAASGGALAAGYADR